MSIPLCKIKEKMSILATNAFIISLNIIQLVLRLLYGYGNLAPLPTIYQSCSCEYFHLSRKVYFPEIIADLRHVTDASKGCIKYTTPGAGIKLTTIMMMFGTYSIDRYKCNYRTIMATMGHNNYTSYVSYYTVVSVL